jgi:hypothetical protein
LKVFAKKGTHQVSAAENDANQEGIPMHFIIANKSFFLFLPKWA